MTRDTGRFGGSSGILGQAVVVVVVLGAAALVVGSLLGQPILLGYVTTGSMRPTISPGDGFVAIPSAVAGHVQNGAVVVFRAERLHGGGLTTHRVVGRTAEGYLTKGDANSVTDQRGGEPPVKDAQIVAEALQVDGHVVVVPHLGTLVVGVQDLFSTVQGGFAGVLGLGGRQVLALLLLGGSLLGYAWSVRRDRTTRRRTRERSRDLGVDPRHLLLGLVLVVVVAATAAMVVPAGPTAYGFVSSSYDVPGARVIGVGQTERTSYHAENPGVVPVTVFLDTQGRGITVEPTAAHLAPGTGLDATVTLTAPPRTGYFRRFVVEHRYLAVLPTSVIRALYAVHPWLPVVVIDALLGGSFYLLGLAVVGTSRLRMQSRHRRRSSLSRLWNAFR